MSTSSMNLLLAAGIQFNFVESPNCSFYVVLRTASTAGSSYQSIDVQRRQDTAIIYRSSIFYSNMCIRPGSFPVQ